MHVLNNEIKNYIDRSVLCWLATSSEFNIPNVSPKEVFTHWEDTNIIVAHIASPQTIKNIKENKYVCISFIDVFIQKGFQIKGIAELITKSNSQYRHMAEPLRKIAGEKFPFSMIISILVTDVRQILAPTYRLYPDTSEQEQIDSAMKTYGVQKRDPEDDE